MPDDTLLRRLRRTNAPADDAPTLIPDGSAGFHSVLDLDPECNAADSNLRLLHAQVEFEEPAAVEAFKSELAAWPDRKIEKSADARNMILALADLAAQDKVVQDRSSFVVVLALEFAYGACAGLDHDVGAQALEAFYRFRRGGNPRLAGPGFTGDCDAHASRHILLPTSRTR